MGLSDGRKSFPIGLAVLIQYRSVTDTQPASHPATPQRCRSYYDQRSGVEPKKQMYNKQAVSMVTRYAPAPLLPVGAPMPCTPPSRRNVSVVSHAQYVLMVTAAPASRVKAAPSKAAWWPLTLKVVSKSRVMLANSVPISVFLGLSVLELGPMYTTDVRQTSDKSIA